MKTCRTLSRYRRFRFNQLGASDCQRLDAPGLGGHEQPIETQPAQVLGTSSTTNAPCVLNFGRLVVSSFQAESISGILMPTTLVAQRQPPRRRVKPLICGRRSNVTTSMFTRALLRKREATPWRHFAAKNSRVSVPGVQGFLQRCDTVRTLDAHQGFFVLAISFCRQAGVHTHL